MATPLRDGPPATLRPRGAAPAGEARERLRGLAAAMAVGLLALGFGGYWAYSQVRASLKDVRFAGLSALLEAEMGVLTTWIDEKKRAAERWASTPRVQRAAIEIVHAARSDASPEATCALPARRTLLAEITPYVQIEQAVVFNLVTRDGRIVASNHDAYCGLRVRSAEFMERVAPVFSGRTVFVRPYPDAERLGVAGPFPEPLVWVETPVRDEDGRIIAALGFGRPAGERFGTLLALTTAHSSREAYAFDRRGYLLTQSRFVEELRKAGTVAPGASGILQLQLRAPDGEMSAIVREALRAEEGALLEPYVNYRGASVIGAWRWIAEKEMAVAVEIEAAEAFAPLQYVQIAFGGLFAFLVLATAAAGASSLWAVRLRLREARRLGPYELEREIGEGGMSRVYLARHALLKRPTAVKVLKTALASDEVVTRFEREVQLCSRLSHPNTIEIYDYGRTRDGTFYYAMEYLVGISIEELVRRKGPMPVARAVHALRQVCGSLQDAHEQGLVHRDVKPHNLMLCVRGAQHDVVKVLDFGLVKEVRNPHTRDITQFAKVLGTPLYMAPERLRNPADADARADIYAVGAVAYFMLTGRHVFRAETDHDLVYRILNDPAPTLAEGGATGVPQELEALVARCLAKEREARPASMEEVIAVLQEIARRHPWTAQEARRWWRQNGAELGVADLPG